MAPFSSGFQAVAYATAAAQLLCPGEKLVFDEKENRAEQENPLKKVKAEVKKSGPGFEPGTPGFMAHCYNLSAIESSYQFRDDKGGYQLTQKLGL